MKFALSLGSKEFSFSIGKSISPDGQAWINGTDVTENEQGTKLSLPYMQSAWIYIAVSVLAENVAQIPFRISRIGGGQARRVRSLAGASDSKLRAARVKALCGDILDSGDVVDLFEHPHPTMSKTLFWEQVVSWLSLRGEFFVCPLDAADQPVDLTDRNPRVSRMLTLAPELFWHIVPGYDWTGWRYTGSPLLTPLPSEMLLPSEVIHCRTVNPYLYWRGLGAFLVGLTPGTARLP